MNVRDTGRIQKVCHCLQKVPRTVVSNDALLAGNRKMGQQASSAARQPGQPPLHGKQWHALVFLAESRKVVFA
jgi:hypothetical protein